MWLTANPGGVEEFAENGAPPPVYLSLCEVCCCCTAAVGLKKYTASCNVDEIEHRNCTVLRQELSELSQRKELRVERGRQQCYGSLLLLLVMVMLVWVLKARASSLLVVVWCCCCCCCYCVPARLGVEHPTLGETNGVPLCLSVAYRTTRLEWTQT